MSLLGREPLIEVQELLVHLSSHAWAVQNPPDSFFRSKSLLLPQIYLGQILGHLRILHRQRNAPSLGVLLLQSEPGFSDNVPYYPAPHLFEATGV